jgi:hypothetical protein
MWIMSTNPIFPVPANANTKSAEENLKALETLCHVVEYKAPFALVHASPLAVARISTELSLPVFPSKRTGEYYAVKVAAAQAAPAPAPRLSVVPQAPAAPAPVSAPSDGTTRMNIGGDVYIVRETQPKRRVDARRWEARKLGDEVGKPRVVTFQDAAGTQAACSCEDWIYRHSKRPDPDCKHCKAFKAAYASRTAANVA